MRYYQNNYPAYSDIITPGSISFSDEADPIMEPVTLADTKSFLRIAGTSEDPIVTGLIKAAREWVEKMTGISLIPRTVVCTVEVSESVELPYGPVLGAVTDQANNEFSYTVTSGPFPEFTATGRYNVKYSAGYTPENIPESLKMAIMCRVGATYENRGDTDTINYSQMAKSHYRPYRRLMSWV